MKRGFMTVKALVRLLLAILIVFAIIFPIVMFWNILFSTETCDNMAEWDKVIERIGTLNEGDSIEFDFMNGDCSLVSFTPGQIYLTKADQNKLNLGGPWLCMCRDEYDGSTINCDSRECLPLPQFTSIGTKQFDSANFGQGTKFFTAFVNQSVLYLESATDQSPNEIKTSSEVLSIQKPLPTNYNTPEPLFDNGVESSYNEITETGTTLYK